MPVQTLDGTPIESVTQLFGTPDAAEAPRKIVMRNIAELRPYEKNARTHSQQQVKQIAASIKEFGWTNPILIDEEDNVIAGHGRLLGGAELGETQAPTLTLTGLTDAQKRAYIIADNKLALNAGWDIDVLSEELKRLATDEVDFGLMGFDAREIEQLIGMPQFAAASADEQGRLDLTAQITCPHCGEVFVRNYSP